MFKGDDNTFINIFFFRNSNYKFCIVATI
ncbi:hypothetical protein CY0110_18717 [Crocosphaera chwakensis CCY0110]|uniref:Uncharacterized protein n=1 Tax=Crocosphaera chwakensis CCY0110 TaxID=391612 RepID=A3IJ75_9CHRO|nr:hypothetical protein CY0110_18717 [Crocosphaera chwakensis CCY0110]